MTLKELALLIFVFWNVLTFLTYGIDKKQAEHGRWRIPEKTLLLESILFGGIGAFLGGKIFHHKTLKWYFKACWSLGMVIDIAVLYWYIVIWK